MEAPDPDLGTATIVYEGPDGEPIEEDVDNELVAYFQDHWILKTGEDEAGRDQVRRIPAQRVFYVERSVEAFEDEVSTVADQVWSLTDELRRKIPGGGDGGREGDEDSGEPVEITVQGEPAADTARGGEPDDVETHESEGDEGR